MSDQSVEVLPVPEGSIIVLRNVAFGGDDDAINNVVESLREGLGHDKFVMLHLNDGGEVDVWGPDVDVAAKIRDLLGLAG